MPVKRKTKQSLVSKIMSSKKLSILAFMAAFAITGGIYLLISSFALTPASTLGKIAYQCDARICIMNADGSNNRQITQNKPPHWCYGATDCVEDPEGVNYWLPSISPNGKTIVANKAETRRDPNSPDGYTYDDDSLVFIDVETSKETTFTKYEQYWGATWSNSGQQIAVLTWGSVYVFDLTPGASPSPKVIPVSSAGIGDPDQLGTLSWSSDDTNSKFPSLF